MGFLGIVGAQPTLGLGHVSYSPVYRFVDERDLNARFTCLVFCWLCASSCAPLQYRRHEHGGRRLVRGAKKEPQRGRQGSSREE